MAINKLLFIPEWRTTATVSYPEANYKLLYPKSTDEHWYIVDSDGTEKRIETGLDFRNGLTTTTLATSSVLRARLDIALGVGLTFAGNYAGSTISVFGVTPNMLSSVGSGTAGYVLTSNGSSFNWVTPSSLMPSISGTTNRVSKFSTPTTLSDSIMVDDGTRIVIGATPTFALSTFNIDGDAYISGDIFLTDSTNTFLRYSSGILIQTDEDIVFSDETGYNYLDLMSNNLGSYTFSILENTVLLGDDGTYKYLVSNDIDSVSFGNTSSTLTYSIFSDTPGVLRIQDSSEGVDKIFVSDVNGYGTWQYLNSGLGLTVSGLTYSVLVDNGLSIIGSSVSLGGILFQDTTINANSFDLIVNSASTILFNTSTFDVEADGFVSIDAGSGSVQIIGDDSVILSASNSVDILTTGTFGVLFDQSTVTDNSGNGLGMVYANDYSATFVTNSLVSKLYVDNQIFTGPTGPTGSIGSTGATGPQGETGSSLLGIYYKELVSGGAVYNSGLTFDVSQLSYTFYGPLQTTFGATQVTFTTGDPTYSRIDAIVVDDDSPYGAVSIIQGSASPSPITPEISNDQLLVQYIIIPSGATALTFNQDIIYNENVEWNFSVYDQTIAATGSIVPTASTPSPYIGSNFVRAVGVNRRRWMRFQRGSVILSSDYTSISFAVYFPSVIPSTRTLVVRFRTGTTFNGNGVAITSTFASRTVTGTWQLVVVPLYLFNLTGNIDGLDIQMTGRDDTNLVDWSIDYIQLQGGTAPVYLSNSGLISTITAGQGLTGGGSSTTVNLDVNTTNGLSIINDSVGLGGTLSQDTIINTNGATFGILTSNTFAGLRISDPLQVSLIGYSDGSTTFSFYRSLESESTIQSIGSNGGFDFTLDSLNQEAIFSDSTLIPKGLQYSNDYSANFVTHSLVDKNYVDTQISNISSSVNITTVTGSNTIFSIDKSLYAGAFFEYTVSKGTNARAGSIMSIWNGTFSSFTDTTTSDIGSTSDVTFLISATSSNAILTASSLTDNWVINSIMRKL